MNLDCKREIDGKFVNHEYIILINPYKNLTTIYIFLFSLYSDGVQEKYM